MDVPAKNSPLWEDVVRGNIVVQFESLAVQMFIGRVRVELLLESSAQKIASLAQEFYTLVMATKKLPAVQRDLQKLTAARPRFL